MIDRTTQEQPGEDTQLAGESRVRVMRARRHAVDLDDHLLAAAQARTGSATFRETITRAVTEHLPHLVERLREAGVTSRPTGRRRPRNIDESIWDALAEAEGEVALGVIELARACLVRAARGDDDAGT